VKQVIVYEMFFPYVHQLDLLKLEVFFSNCCSHFRWNF